MPNLAKFSSRGRSISSGVGGPTHFVPLSRSLVATFLEKPVEQGG